jgi:hypothetical protein
MTAPQWLRSTGAATAIVLSSFPMLAAMPGVMSAHDSLNRELAQQFVPSQTALTAAVAVAVVANPHGQSSANE